MSLDELLNICAQALCEYFFKSVNKRNFAFCTSTQSPYQTIFEFRPCLKD